MAGLDSSGFAPDTLQNIQARIKAKLEAINPGFDFSPESPDGQLINIFSLELAQVWSELALVYDSYNPSAAFGAGLRNLGTITGIQYGNANRSYATLQTTGTDGTVISSGSLVSDNNGNEFYVAFAAKIPASIVVVAVTPGPIDVVAGTITNIVTPVAGWTGVVHNTDGVKGTLAMTEAAFRNYRFSTVMRNSSSVVEAMQARLIELGLGQARITNNTDPSNPDPVDGTPPNTIQVAVGEVPATITNEMIAEVILEHNSPGCPTFGNTAVVIKDSQGYDRTVNFSLAVEVPVEMVVDVTFLADNTAGAADNIVNALHEHINLLKAGEDIIWSRLFSYITPYAKAQVNTLTIAKVGEAQGTVNIPITQNEFASIQIADIALTVDGGAP